MFSRIILTILFLSSTLIAGCGEKSVNETPSWNHYPISVTVSSEFSTSEINTIKNELKKWDELHDKKIFQFKGVQKHARDGVHFKKEDSSHRVGHTKRRIINEKVVSAVVSINKNSVCSSCCYQPSYVVSHEIGHVLGLPDVEQEGSIMHMHYPDGDSCRNEKPQKKMLFDLLLEKEKLSRLL